MSMRILFCNFEYPPLGGGGGIVNAFLAEELAKRHEVSVLTSGRDRLLRERRENGVQVIRVPVVFRRQEAVANLPSMLAFLAMGTYVGRELVQKRTYDLINTHFVFPTGPVGDALARAARVPNVLSLVGGDLYDPSKRLSPHRHWALRVWATRLLRRADLIVGGSSNTLKNMRTFYAPEIEGVQIPLGIPRPVLTPVSRREYGFAEDEVLMVTVGRLVPRKGLGQLIAMMETLGHDRARLLIVGTGPEEPFLKEECRKRHLDGRVVFLGRVSDREKFRILQMADMYVSTSQHEGFGLVFLEAMTCGLPIVCYDHGGQTDFLRDEETGYLVPLNDLELFKNRCKLLVGSPGSRKSMGANNQREVAEFYIERCAMSYEKVFEGAIQAWNTLKRPVAPALPASSTLPAPRLGPPW
jgi:glycosyltransferase involved in cell wall biosynthesis